MSASTFGLILAGCATTGQPPVTPLDPQLNWQAPLPHQGEVADLSAWWAAQGDPMLVELIEAAQAVSPTVASAASRIAQSRAAREVAGASLLPRVDASASAARGKTSPLFPQNTSVQGGLQASWEVDLFGGNAAARDAAQARYEGSRGQWHDARISVAAEVANQYLNFRNCERQLKMVQTDAESRVESLRLTQLLAVSGFQPSATGDLARASAAEGRARVALQRAQCDLTIKALVALTEWAEPDLRARLSATVGPGEFTPFPLTALPASLLAQRPDLFTAEREVAAASADLGSAQAQRYPRLTLSGSVGRLRFAGGGLTETITTWQIGPVAFSVPLFDGGRISANIEAARARYAEAVALYRARARLAVREVEEALVTLDSLEVRESNWTIAVEGQRSFLAATRERYRGGLASLFELEETRRNTLAAELSLLSLQRERQGAWIALYRAAGGGWDRSEVG
ncbi:MAG: efflux transporter outer membrane subunit, partial [Burkholderiaceae bacterium]